MNRLTLRHLTFIGANVEAASVDFAPGTTVIRGPSDTGKSFIVDAIDFMLGAAKLKEIPEREGYSTALLGLTLPSGELVTLSRAVNGGNFGLYEGDVRSGPLDPQSQTLSAMHSASSTGNLSRYFLTWLGLDEKRIRRNQRNQTDSLSFRNVAHLCVVDETQMQAETPPALSGRPTDKTKEVSTLKLLLQNQDDSDLIETQPKRERDRLTDAKSEVVDRLLAGLEEQVRNSGGITELRAQAGRLNVSIAEQTSSIQELTDTRSGVMQELARIDRLAMAIQRRSDDATSLDSRFQLLRDQYTSDLGRLEMIAEAGTLLGYFSPGQCAFCGADSEHQHFNEDNTEDTTYFRESVLAEHRKTSALRSDLLETLVVLSGQRDELSQRHSGLIESARDVRIRLADLDNALRPYRSSLNELLESRSAADRQLAAYEQIERLVALQTEFASQGQEEVVAAVTGMQLTTLDALSEEISIRLQAWGVPDADRVRYDRDEQDIVGGAQLRSAHGKGIRAILHAAFTIALAQYCFNRELPHPGFVVLDSPLVTYRPPEEGEPTDPDDVLDASVAARFYADIQRNFDGQILIMENMDPPDGLDAESVDVPFTKTASYGRYGYFPVREPVESATSDRP